MSLSAGSRLGPYEIVSPLGAGGMGEVYRARDTKLNRDIALKILPEPFALDPDRLARFTREAQVLASLNHPNIAAIYGSEESNGVQALVLELVEGPTLADRIAHGPIPLDEALPIARQIAAALEAAHDQGIIHRDLKPANIKVSEDGTVKVLDFGLAKLTDAAAGSSVGPAGLSQSPTITTPAMMTGVGVILGTAAYMAPEQAKGRVADRRSDVWAFGCVLYEMLTGTRAFEGEDVGDTLATVLKGEPNWNALPPDVPPAIRTLIQRCLAKDRRQRIADISTAQYVLDAPAALAALAPMVAAPPPPLWRRLALFSAPALIAGAMMATAVWLAMRPATSPPLEPVRFTIAPPADLRLWTPGIGPRDVAISPDGRRVVYHTGTGPGKAQLLIRAIDQLESTPLHGLTGTASPFISPDSRSIGFVRVSSNELQKVSMTGGPAVMVARIQGILTGASWGPDDTIVFATDTRATGLLRVPAGGGEPRALTTPDAGHGELDHYWPSFLPGGRAVLFTILPQSGLENMQVAVLDLRNGQRKTLIGGASQAEYVETGHLVYASAGTLRAVRFDPVRLEVSGDPVPVVEQVLTKANGTAEFSVSRTGSLVYVAGTTLSATTHLTWVDRAGRPTGTIGLVGPYRNPALSPDGTRVAVERTDPQSGTQDIWLIDVARGVASRFTFDAHNDIYPVWSPDGSRIAFGSDRDGGVFGLYEKPANGATSEVLLLKAAEGAAPYSWAPDGQMLVYRTGQFRLGLLPRAGTQKPHLLEQTAFLQGPAQVSPTGRWIAYSSSESGRQEVYVRSFPTPGGKYQISKDGGNLPRWRRDGKELFFYSLDGQLTAVPVGGDTALDVGTAVPLFRAPLLPGGIGVRQQYDVTRDGQRFLLNLITDDTPTATITVVVNGTAGLKP
jgi:serine/threonine-protein kinase